MKALFLAGQEQKPLEAELNVSIPGVSFFWQKSAHNKKKKGLSNFGWVHSHHGSPELNGSPKWCGWPEPEPMALASGCGFWSPMSYSHHVFALHLLPSTPQILSGTPTSKGPGLEKGASNYFFEYVSHSANIKINNRGVRVPFGVPLDQTQHGARTFFVGYVSNSVNTPKQGCGFVPFWCPFTPNPTRGSSQNKHTPRSASRVAKGLAAVELQRAHGANDHRAVGLQATSKPRPQVARPTAGAPVKGSGILGFASFRRCEMRAFFSPGRVKGGWKMGASLLFAWNARACCFLASLCAPPASFFLAGGY